MSIDLRSARVLVTGGNGFLGRHVCAALKAAGATVVIPQPRPEPNWLDLTNGKMLEMAFGNCGPDYVFHLAGYNGGIQFNADYPADIFVFNTTMAMNVLEACKTFKVKKVVSVVASCAYPEWEWCHYKDHGYRKYWRDVMFEDDFLDGPPHDSVACHGYAKRNLQLASRFYRQQYGLAAVCACPTTLYGPGDSYDPARTKVMGAMVKRFCDAADSGEQEVTCWGTGKPMREFLYVEDAAKLLVQVLEHYDDSTLPLNLGTGQELTVKDVAETVARGVEFSGRIGWDASKPDGQSRKRLDLTRMKSILPGVAVTPIDEGIRQTAADYRARRAG
jgi:GDP-L-fucose synthase